MNHVGFCSVIAAFVFGGREEATRSHLELQRSDPVEDREIITISTFTGMISKINHRQLKHVTPLMKEQLCVAQLIMNLVDV